MWQVILLSIVTASISFTVAEMKLFAPFREWIKRKSSLFGELFSCGYCFGHWIAFILVAIYRPRLFQFWWLLDYFLTALVVAWLAAVQWIIMCWLFAKTGKWRFNSLEQKCCSKKVMSCKCNICKTFFLPEIKRNALSRIKGIRKAKSNKLVCLLCCSYSIERKTWKPAINPLKSNSKRLTTPTIKSQNRW